MAILGLVVVVVVVVWFVLYFWIRSRQLYHQCRTTQAALEATVQVLEEANAELAQAQFRLGTAERPIFRLRTNLDYPRNPRRVELRGFANCDFPVHTDGQARFWREAIASVLHRIFPSARIIFCYSNGREEEVGEEES
jgi:hypothetical protein